MPTPMPTDGVPYIVRSQQSLPPRLQRSSSGSAILKKPDVGLPTLGNSKIQLALPRPKVLDPTGELHLREPTRSLDSGRA